VANAASASTVESIRTRRTMSIPAACAHVGVSRRTIYNWLHAGKLEFVRTAGGAIRIFEDTLYQEQTNHSPAPWRGVRSR
jgi:excisionase family DNA binding protein